MDRLELCVILLAIAALLINAAGVGQWLEWKRWKEGKKKDEGEKHEPNK